MANKRRPQGDGTIRKRNDGRWEARIMIGHKNDGSPMYKSAFAKTQKSALKQLHQLLDLYRDVDLTEECRMTLGEWMDKWLDEYIIFTVRESTLDSYRSLTKNQVKKFIGDKQLSSLTTADMQKFYNKIKKEGRMKPKDIPNHIRSYYKKKGLDADGEIPTALIKSFYPQALEKKPTFTEQVAENFNNTMEALKEQGKRNKEALEAGKHIDIFNRYLNGPIYDGY